MKAVQIKDGRGPAENMYIAEDVPVPVPGEGQALVKVHAFGINRMDLIQRSSVYPLPPGAPTTLGVEFSGVIVKLGSGGDNAFNGLDDTGFAVGESVFGLVPGGAYAEYVVCNFKTLMKIPKGLSYETAAAIPENWFTAIQVVKTVGHFKKRDKVLFHAGASGIGVAVVQLAQAMGCRRIFTTVGSEDKKKFVKEKLTFHTALPDEVVPINYKEDDFLEVIHKYDPDGVNLIIDPVGGSYFDRNVEALAQDGRLVIMGLMGGRTAEIDLGKLLYKRIEVVGTALRSRSPDYQQELRDWLVQTLLKKFSNGKLTVLLDSVFDWREVAKAHKQMEGNHNMGKIICTIIPSQP